MAHSGRSRRRLGLGWIGLRPRRKPSGRRVHRPGNSGRRPRESRLGRCSPRLAGECRRASADAGCSQRSGSGVPCRADAQAIRIESAQRRQDGGVATDSIAEGAKPSQGSVRAEGAPTSGQLKTAAAKSGP